METMILEIVLFMFGAFALGLYLGANVTHEFYRRALNKKLEKLNK